MDKEVLRQVDSLRFSWHERVIADPFLTKHGAAVKFAGLVMHRFRSKQGFAQISMSAAARFLGLSKRTVQRARNVLMKRGWLSIVWRPGGDGWDTRSNKYTLSGGPDDLLLDSHSDGDEGDAPT